MHWNTDYYTIRDERLEILEPNDREVWKIKNGKVEDWLATMAIFKKIFLFLHSHSPQDRWLLEL